MNTDTTTAPDYGEPKAMTDQEINIKIAEHCGKGHLRWYYQFKFRSNPEYSWDTYPCATKELAERTRQEFIEGGDEVTEVEPYETPHRVPDYCNDLNAMHEAEATMDEAQRRTYFYHLFGSQRLDDGDLWKAVHATARQRAEAFYRVINTNTKEP